jgi:hypothetical protein
MRIKLFMTCIVICAYCSPLIAQQHSYAPNTDNDGGEEVYNCKEDIRRFCNGPSLLLFELESCLESHFVDLKPSCRAQLGATDFRKYHHD